MALARPKWLRPLLLVAALGVLTSAASGLLLMRDVRLSNFCNEAAEVSTAHALRDVGIRRFHDRAAFPVGGCVALAIAFGGAAGAALERRSLRWAVAVLAALALGGFLTADFTGKKEAWQTLSSNLAGWGKLPIPAGMSLPLSRPQCDPSIRPGVERLVRQIYWVHAVVGSVMAVAAALLGFLGMSWRPQEGRR